MVKLFVLPVLFSVVTATAETSENFNSRKGVPVTGVRARLQSSCWTFQHFDVNQDGWNPRIEGDGAMVAKADAIQQKFSGIHTPLLSLGSDLGISFDYVFSDNFSADETRWIKICLANPGNEVLQVLDVLEFDGGSATMIKKYQNSFSGITAGEYRLVLQYGGKGGAARIAVDQLEVSASVKFQGGCGTAPLLMKSKITGRPDRSAFGSLLLNEDGDVNRELTAYLIRNSADGDVKLNADGTFVFTPRKGFEGTSTSFSYKVCDEAAGNLCSDNTIVRIDFPKASTTLVDFKGSYKYNGNVELVWNTATGNNTKKFELERSFDGRRWQKAGTVSNNEEVNVYGYVDFVGRGAAHKRDIFYRLRQTNADGSMLLSKMLVVRVFNTKTLTMISVTPSPAQNDITANVQLLEDCYVSMRVLDNSGSAILHQLEEGSRGLNRFSVDGSAQLEPGTYMLELVVNSKERMLVKLEKE